MADMILTIGEQRHLGWQRVAVSRSMERGADFFELTLTDRWGGGSGIASARGITSGEPCTVHLDNELLITGYTDAVEPSYDHESHEIIVQGRSRAADLVDCSRVGQEFKNQTLTQIASKLCAPFGITVKAATNVGKPFKVLRLATGQSLFEFLEYAARIRAVRLVANAAGELVITNAGTTYADTALVFGENIKAARGRFDLSQAYSEYSVVAQQDGVSLSASAQAEVKGTAKGAGVKRYRPIAIESDIPADLAGCTARAAWEASTRYGRAQSAVLTVAGWQQKTGGRVWQPNERVQVTDPWLGITGERLISEVRLTKDQSGTLAELTVMPLQAFALTALPEPDDGGWL